MTTDLRLPRATTPHWFYVDDDQTTDVHVWPRSASYISAASAGMEGHQPRSRASYEQVAARHASPSLARRLVSCHGVHFTLFSLIGGALFLIGLAVEPLMTRLFHEPSDLSALAWIVITVQASFLLNYRLTWRDRGTALWVSFWRYNHQRIVTVAATLLFYAGLLRLKIGHLAAAVFLTVVFAIINYIYADRFVFRRGDAPAKPVAAAGAVKYPAPPVSVLSDTPLPEVSVVIPCQDDRRTIRATVESLLCQDYPRIQQVILIGSPMDTTWEGLDGIRDHRLRIQEVAAPKGISGTNLKCDLGIRESSSEIVALVDSGMVLRRDWLRRAVARLDESEANATGLMESTNGDFVGRFVDRRRLGTRTPHGTPPTRWDGTRVNAVAQVGQTMIERRTFAVHSGQLPPSSAYARPYTGTRTAWTSGTGGHVATISTPLRTAPGASRRATPPSDAEKYRYLQGGQRRWFIALQYLAFLGVAISFAGFTTSSYETFIFFIPLVAFAVEQTLALYTSTRRRRVDLASHLHTVKSWAPLRYPSVDVFVPTAGEELDVLDNTMRHMKLLEWPGRLRVYILDDRGRASVRYLAAEYGFSYLARPGSEYKKAGNLRYGAEHSNGEIIVVFDADFVPRPEFLLELVPYMDEPTVGIVQSPQFFDTTKHMNWIQRCAGSTQELFYRFIQPSRDALGAAVCVGTSAVYRRAALDAIGGFPKISQSEDIYTGLWMLNAGYSIRYVPVAVSKGIAPDNVDNFIAQQYRWCEGSMTMLADRHFHTTPHLSLPARLCFWSGFLYYISTALSSLIIPLPAIVMAWFYPEWVRSWNTIWLAGALASWLIAYPLVMRGRWRIEVLRVQTIYGFAHLFNIIHLIQKRVAEWHPTGSKAPAPIAVKVKRFYTVYLGLTLSAAAIGLLLRAYQDGFTLFAGMLVFFVINLYVVGPLVVSGIGDEFRRLRRHHAAEPVIQTSMRAAA
jgi:cellulose synthase (UDP-forming)